MTCLHVLDLLNQSKPILVERYHVENLALFGSTTRNTACDDSDVDIVVSFGAGTQKRLFEEVDGDNQ